MSDINNPLVFLKMNSFSNGISPDSSGNQHNANGQSISIVSDDTFGNCSAFDGESSFLKLDSVSGSIFRQTNNQSTYYPVFSMTFWIKPTEINEKYSAYYPNNIFFSLSDPQGDDLMSMGFSPLGNLQFQLNLDGNNSTTPLPASIPVAMNEWHFVALVVNDNNYLVQFDSQTYSFTSSQNRLSESTFNFWLGLSFATYETSEDANGMIGSMANMRAYNSALDANDLALIQVADLNSPVMQIFLPLSQTSDNSTPDFSVNHYPAVLCGNPPLVADVQFGTAMSFNGTDQYIAINNFYYQPSEPIYEITVQAWIKVDPANTSNMIIASFDRNFYWELSLVSDGNTSLLLKWDTVDRNGNPDTLTGTIRLNDGLWHYVTASYSSGLGTKSIYNNADLDTSKTAHLGLPLGKSSGVTRYGFVAAGSNTAGFNTSAITSPTFNGEMCQFRLYNTALSTAAITRNMYAGRTAAASYTIGYPLWFGLQEENQQNVIYIYDQPSGHSITCSITNTSAIPLSIPAGGTPGSDNYQFAIIFRPGTLSQDALTSMRLMETDWTMSAATVIAGGAVAFYFTSVNAITMLPMSVITFTLMNVSASNAGGTRSTRLSFIYSNISYYESSTPISGNSEISVDIINREGAKDIPLSFGFKGRNEIFCGTVPQNSEGYSLHLLITNILSGTGGMLVNGKSTDAPTRFRISFETAANTDNSNVLNTNSIINGATAVINDTLNGGQADWEDTLRNDNSDSGNPYWSFTPSSSFIFEPGQCIQVDFSGIIPDNIPGNANVYLDWEDLPGYWDGRIAIQLLKTNTMIADNGNIGVGFDTPNLSLTLKADGYGINNPGTSLEFYTNGRSQLSLDSNGNLYLNGTNSSQKSFTNNFGNIKTTGAFAVENTSQNGLQFQNGGSSNVILGIDSGNNFSIQTKSGNSNTTRLSISTAGAVGIGTASQSNITLSINGSSAASKTAAGGILNIGSPTQQYLQIDGSNIISKNTNAQTGPLNLTGNTVTLNGAATVNDGLTIKYSNATKLAINNSGITFSPNVPVIGIPVVQWSSVIIPVAAGTGSSGLTATKTVTFNSTVKQATCAIQCWTLRYDDDHDNQFKMGWVNTSCTINSSDHTKVNVTVNIMLTDADGSDGNDTYTGTVTVLVLASVTNSISS